MKLTLIGSAKNVSCNLFFDPLIINDLFLSYFNKFIPELKGTSTMAEGQVAHFEAQIEPIHDSNLKIEFFHNGKPLKQVTQSLATVANGIILEGLQFKIAKLFSSL